MRVLIVTQIFLPEMGALSNRMYPIARQLVAAGHEVSVATGMPNYPAGVVFADYRGKRFLQEEIDGVKVFRTAYFTVPRNQSKWGQLRSYLSFIPAAFHSGLRAGKADVVFVTSPPIFPAVAAIGLSKLYRAKLVFDIRDLWPDEIVACGAARDGSLSVKMIRHIERWVYRVADCVTCTTRAFMTTVVERGVSREKTVFVPNGADLELFRPLPPDNPIASEYALGNRFVVMYSGLIGIKHGLERILQAAEILRDERDIVFFLLGAGARLDALKSRVKEMRLDNIQFGGERSVTEVPQILARADVCLSSLLPEPYLEKIVSVKVFEYFACAKPVVVAQAGETAEIVRESKGGIVVPPGDAPAMAQAILALYRDPSLRQEMGKRGRQFVECNYSRALTAARLENTLCTLQNVPSTA